MAKQKVLHNKLVRDRIPEIIKQGGAQVEVEKVEDEVRFLRLLIDKLEEEAQEVALADEEHMLEELGDVETVVDGILRKIGKTRKELKEQQESKDSERGSLNEGIFLISTTEEEE